MLLADVLRIDGEWTSLPYAFPRGAPVLTADPAIYCWFVDGSPAYVGQAESLKRRITGYEKPGPSQTTNLRLNSHFHRCLQSGQRVELRVLSSIRLNGLRLPTNSLKQKRLRDLLEAYCIWVLSEQGHTHTLLNM